MCPSGTAKLLHSPLFSSGFVKQSLTVAVRSRAALFRKCAAQQFKVIRDLTIGQFQLGDPLNAVHDSCVVTPAKTTANFRQ